MHNIQVISSFSIFLPLILAAIKLKTGDLKLRLFFVFLFIGALVDFIGWINFRTTIEIGILKSVILAYSIIEAMFFTWTATVFIVQPGKKRIRILLGCLICFLFAIRFIFIYQFNPNLFLSPIVESLYLVSTAFLTGFSLLKMAENVNDILKYSWFWILSGIFFYSFGSFFVDAFKGTEVISEIWIIRNIINIIQYIFFVIGLMMIQNKRII